MKRLVSSTWFRIAAIILVLPATLIFCVMGVVLVISLPIALLYQGAQAVMQFSLGLIWVKRDTKPSGLKRLKNG
jgi:hypothetical protein